jgi:serine/threonine-protein kinase RsbT
MVGTGVEILPVASEHDVTAVRQRVRAVANELRFGVVDATKLATASSELARNALVHGGGGTVRLERVSEAGRVGLRLTFADEGAGIADVGQALADGFTTNGGMGLGLGGSKRLMHEFAIESHPGKGTRITVTHWRRS